MLAKLHVVQTIISILLAAALPMLGCTVETQPAASCKRTG